jgi:alpha-L-rhamnosidase
MDQSLIPERLLCESRVDPLGIDEPQPRFSWLVETDREVARQSACQILVASSSELLGADEGDLWDSGKIISAQCSGIAYAGRPLRSRQKCFWKVRLWDHEGLVGPFSAVACFEMGLLQADDWKAGWMGWPGGRAGFAACFRCAFRLDRPAARGRLYITGLGVYEAVLNGRLMDGLLQPAVSDSSRRVYYNTFDVTADLQPGENVLAAVVGTGWHGTPVLLAQLEVVGPDGEVTVVATNREASPWVWMTAAGPTRTNSLFDGELYDARLEKAGWDDIGYDDEHGRSPSGHRAEGWMPACRMPGHGGVMRAQPIPAIAATECLSPRSRSEPQPGVFVFDFGQNHAGRVRFSVEGLRGAEVTLKYAEALRPDGTVDQDNLRTARATDTYIMKGGGREQWEPRFTYHGYRYVQVEGWPGVPEEDALQSCVLHSPLASRGEFSCSEELFNRIHRMILWTERSNLHGIPTDCPQRDERMGWLNDLAARSEELIYNFESVGFLEKFVDDIADTQDPRTGAITDTAPFHWGHRPADPVSIAYLLIPVLLHQHYGDTRPMARHYAGMKRWVDFLTSQSDGGIVGYSHYGDWAPPASEALAGSEGVGAISARTPGDLVSTAFYFRSLVLLAHISHLLGETTEAARCNAQAKAVSHAFHRKFWNSAAGGYGSGNQACNSIALYFGLVPSELRPTVVAALVAEVHRCDRHLSTGNLATKYLLEVLSDEGHADLAFTIAAQTTYPGWGFMLSRGATTLWERWEELQGQGMNSHNHPMLGSIGSWFYRHVAGLRFREQSGTGTAPGVEFHIPIFKGLTSARAKVTTVYGDVAVEWKRRGPDLSVSARVPWNCPATLHLPGQEVRPLSSGSHQHEFHIHHHPNQL